MEMQKEMKIRKMQELTMVISDERARNLKKDQIIDYSNKSVKLTTENAKSKQMGIDHVLIMDEVDGMSGNADRAGVIIFPNDTLTN